MITETIVRALATLLAWVGEHLPTVTLPAGLTEALSTLGQYAAQYWQLGHVLPVATMATAFAFFVAASAIALGIKVVRIVASFLTAGGGSAA